MSIDDSGSTGKKSRMVEAYAAAEQLTREAGWSLSPAERLEWLGQAIEFASSAGVDWRREPPAGWDVGPDSGAGAGRP